MRRFINDDVKVKKGGRFFVPITQEELWVKLVNKAKENADEIGYYEDELDAKFKDYDTMDKILNGLIYELRLFQKDMKFEVDAENINCAEKPLFGKTIQGNSLTGIQTLSNGFTFLGIQIGGDWEYPIFMIVYFDGKILRAYIPSYGNCVNLDVKSAFGSEQNTDSFDKEKLIIKYKKLGINIEELLEEYGDFAWSYAYCKKYDVEFEKNDCGYNWDAIKEDILSRLELKK